MLKYIEKPVEFQVYTFGRIKEVDCTAEILPLIIFGRIEEVYRTAETPTLSIFGRI